MMIRKFFDSLVSRRSFFAVSILSLLLPSRALAENGKKSEKRFLRPPGALPEKEFLAGCTKCQKCLQVCHARIITPLPLTAGIAAAHTPTILFSKNYCDLCMKCVDVCSYGVIKKITKEEVDIGVAALVKDSCVAWDWEGCVVCVEKCPEKAIELDEMKRPYIISEKCNGCGACELVCPAVSLRSTRTFKKGIIVVPRGEEGLHE